MLVRSFLCGKSTFEEGRILISDPHQLGVKRCQPLGQILSNSLLRFNRNGIDLQKSSQVHSNTLLQGGGADWYSVHESDAEHRFILQKDVVKTQACQAELCVV